MTPCSTLADEIAALAAEFVEPMPSSATSDGWTEQTWTKWRNIFATLHTRVAAGETNFSGGIARAMDFDGVVSGPLLERAAKVGNALARL